VELNNKVALITGGKRIGLVVARDLASRGVDIAVSYARSQEEANLAVETVRAAGRRAAAFQADLSQPDAAAALVTSVVQSFGRLDILINMASVYVQRPFAELNAAAWDAVMNVDLRGALRRGRGGNDPPRPVGIALARNERAITPGPRA